jgi:hypothetical protein
MPYLVMKGTRGQVITPTGKSIEHYVCQRTTMFSDAETDRGLHFRFSRDGFKLVVSPSDVVRFELTCASCGQAFKVLPYCPTCADLRGER